MINRIIQVSVISLFFSCKAYHDPDTPIVMDLPRCIDQDSFLIEIVSVINKDNSEYYWEGGKKILINRDYYKKESEKFSYSFIKSDSLCKDYVYFLLYERLGREVGSPLYYPRSGMIKIIDCKIDTIIETQWYTVKKYAKSPRRFNKDIGREYLEYVQQVLMKERMCEVD